MIVSGEIDQDLMDPSENVEESTIDIFSSAGKWLYTFESNKIETRSIIKNDRLYTISNMSHVDGQQYINVYKIKYNN